MINNDTLRCRQLINYANKMRDSLQDYDLALILYEHANSILLQKSDPELDLKLYFDWGYTYFDKGDYKAADQLFTKVLDMKLLEKRPAFKAVVLNMAGVNLVRLMAYKRALVYYNEAVDVYTRLKDIKGQGTVYWNMANVFALMENYTYADELFNRAIKLFRENNLIEDYGLVLSSKALIKEKIGQMDSAKLLLIRSMHFKLKRLKNPDSFIQRYLNLGVVYAELKNWDSCFYCLNRAKEMSDSMNTSARFTASYYNFMGYCYSIKGDPKNALANYKKALKIKAGITSFRFLYENISKIYVQTKHYDSALFYNEEALALADSLYKSEMEEYITFEDKKIELLKTNYQYQTDVSNQKQALQELEKRNYVFISIILMLAICVLIFFVYFKQYTYKIKREHLQSELAFLRAQLNPHFLFNSINNIYVLLDQNKERASEILLKFSDLMRYQLYECNVSAILLTKELQFLENYIEFEKLRYSNKITVTSEIDHHHSDHLLIAPLLLQPFIENAFKHTPKHKNQRSAIAIHIQLQGHDLIMTVINTLAASEASALPGGIGLANVKKRLKLLYPNRHLMQINTVDQQYKICLTLSLASE